MTKPETRDSPAPDLEGAAAAGDRESKRLKAALIHEIQQILGKALGNCWRDAYLAERDETPITEEWLRSAGLKHSDGGWYITIASGPNRLFWIGGLMLISSGHNHLSLCTGINTRGQLRRLCAALGINLTEPGAS